MAKPVISVIIVNYNAGKLLHKAVKSIINFPGVEVVVADNASKDGSFIELSKSVKAKNLIPIDNGANIGFGKAVNAAVKKSHGEYICLLNPDAELKKNALSRMVETAKKWNDRAIVAPRLENPDGTPQSSCYKPQTIFNAIKEYWFGVKGSYGKYLPEGSKPVEVNAAVAAAWLVPRSVWDELEGLSPRYFLYFEDLDLCDRARAHGISIVYDPGAVVKHAHGVSSSTNPIVLKLFTNSAWTYHGPVKKLIIDFIIRVRDLFIPPVSWKKLAGVIAAYLTFYLFAASLGYLTLPSIASPLSFIPEWAKSNFLWWSSANFDGFHYLSIAERGYETVLGQSQYAFFPLFPLLISVLGYLMPGFVAAHVIVGVSFLAFVYFVTRWSSKYTDNPLQLLWMVLLSSGSVYLLALYTEPLFLALVSGTFYFADRKDWGKATLATAFATATRFPGVLLVLFLFLTLHKEKIKHAYAYALAGLSGLFAYMLYLWQVSGNPFSWFTAQSGWGKSDLTSPLVTFANYGRALTVEFKPDITHLVVVVEVLVTVILLSLLYKFWQNRKFESAYKWYALGSLTLPLATGSLGSMPRFALALFPLFLTIPSLPKVARSFIATVFIITSILGIILYTRGYWYA